MCLRGYTKPVHFWAKCAGGAEVILSSLEQLLPEASWEKAESFAWEKPQNLQRLVAFLHPESSSCFFMFRF
jgi:hypothetical protein